MSNIVTVGKRLIPREHIALVEPFEVGDASKFKAPRDYRGRVVLLNRDSVLIETAAEAFADANGFKMLTTDNVAANPGIRFRIETFAPAADFKPTKPYATRLLWRDLDGNEQSKLLLTDPEAVLAALVLGEIKPAAKANGLARKRGGRRARSDKTLVLQP